MPSEVRELVSLLQTVRGALEGALDEGRLPTVISRRARTALVKGILKVCLRGRGDGKGWGSELDDSRCGPTTPS